MTSSDDEPPDGTATPLALQANDAYAQDEHESKAFWDSLGDGEGRVQEGNPTAPVPSQPPETITAATLHQQQQPHLPAGSATINDISAGGEVQRVALEGYQDPPTLQVGGDNSSENLLQRRFARESPDDDRSSVRLLSTSDAADE